MPSATVEMPLIRSHEFEWQQLLRQSVATSLCRASTAPDPRVSSVTSYAWPSDLAFTEAILRSRTGRLASHVRHTILKTQGIATAKCLIATDDERFTYNHKANRLSTIQDHFMIIRALKMA